MEINKADAINEIRNLIFEYCWLIDKGDFHGVAQLFKDADVCYNGEVAHHHDPDTFEKTWRESVKTYDDGTPHTFHMCIDPVIEVDTENGTATAKHYTVVLQGYTGKIDPFVMVMDYKFDEFKYVDGKWIFTKRDMSNRATGDVSNHLNVTWG